MDAVILADGTTLSILDTSVEGVQKGLCTMLYQLLATYYVWDLSYPKQYQILTFLHFYLLQDTREKLFKSNGFIKFQKIFDSCE